VAVDATQVQAFETVLRRSHFAGDAGGGMSVGVELTFTNGATYSTRGEIRGALCWLYFPWQQIASEPGYPATRFELPDSFVRRFQSEAEAIERLHEKQR
jgi:hypothetical protein